MSTTFLFSKVCWHRPAMFCLYTWSKLSSPLFEFSLKVKVIRSNPGYLLKNFLLYIIWPVVIAFQVKPLPNYIIVREGYLSSSGIFIEEQSNWSFMATNPVKTNASLLFTLAKFQVFCSDADDHHTKAATCTVAAYCTLFLDWKNNLKTKLVKLKHLFHQNCNLTIFFV